MWLRVSFQHCWTGRFTSSQRGFMHFYICNPLKNNPNPFWPSFANNESFFSSDVFMCWGTKSAQKRGGSPSSFRKSLLKRRPLGSFPMKLCTYSVPWSLTAMAYFRGFTQDCRQKGTLESPMVCLRKKHQKTHQNMWKHLQRQKSKVEIMPSQHENPRFSLSEKHEGIDVRNLHRRPVFMQNTKCGLSLMIV